MTPAPKDKAKGGGKLKTPLFVCAALDDYGLTAPEFRVLSRVTRRGDCIESVSNIARGCKLHPDTVRRALRALVACRLVRRTLRPGQSTLYEPAPIAEWVPSKQHLEGEALPQSRDGSMESDIGHPSETNGDKGNPLKVIPKGNPSPFLNASQGKKKSRERWQIKRDLEDVKSRIREVKESAAPVPNRGELLRKLGEEQRALQKEWDDYPAERLPVPKAPPLFVPISAPPALPTGGDDSAPPPTPEEHAKHCAALRAMLDETLGRVRESSSPDTRK